MRNDKRYIFSATLVFFSTNMYAYACKRLHTYLCIYICIHFQTYAHTRGHMCTDALAVRQSDTSRLLIVPVHEEKI